MPLSPLSARASEHVDAVWDTIVPALEEYIAIPNVSVSFDPEWAAHGHMQRAVDLVRDWCASRRIDGATIEVQELEGRTPLIVVDVPAFGGGAADDTVVLYGHLDKQPEMHGWREGLGAWTPVIEGDRLYGRGGADDGYAAFASLAAIEAVRAGGGAHARCIVLIEASEESGSPDLPAHADALADRIGTPSFVVCLDSGCIDYDRMWLTTSLRGIVNVTLSIDIVREGLHSGESGMIPSTFRIARTLLSRIEDEATGRVLLDSCDVSIPDDRVAEAKATAEEIGTIADRYPLVDGAHPMTPDGAEQLLGRTWHAALSVIGADGLPPTAAAGNVLRPNTTLELSLRTPPTADASRVLAELSQRLCSDPPYGAKVAITRSEAASGWNSPALAPWLVDALDTASTAAFGAPARKYGIGGTIPFMGMLGERFPDAQFAITGVLGPDANAHGPNEYLHLPTARKITLAIAEMLNAHANR
jgi:acetylornithine deacetylase/succinyl-diaminopimelate desuccinylase-like protein